MVSPIELNLSLIGAGDESPATINEEDGEFDRSIRVLLRQLRADGTIHAEAPQRGNNGDGSWNLWADCVIKFSAAAAPVVGGLIGAWLQAHYGRKIKIKVGDIEAEASSIEILDKLLQHAQKLRMTSEPHRSEDHPQVTNRLP